MICDSCGVELRVGDWPYCPHGRGLGMLGEFHERDMGPSFPRRERYQTSLAELRKAERRHGLEALTRQESDIPSLQDQGRKMHREDWKAQTDKRRDILGRSYQEVMQGRRR